MEPTALAQNPTLSGKRTTPLERAISRVSRRLAPPLMLMYIVSFLDRSNVGFAKDALHTSAGITETMYAFGAGLFFVSYATCGFPSNLVLHRIGAKIWISFLMVTWGLVSMSTMFVTGPTSFYLLRLLLGVMEAGFFPGCILYLTYWFPNRVRGQVLGFFYLGVPLSLVLGGPLSGLLLEIRHFAGLDGWQWMFLVEGFLAVVSGIAAFGFFDDRPEVARWLPEDEKRALVEALAQEESERRGVGPTELLPMLRDPHVLRFVLMYGLIQMSVYAAIFYLPAEVSALMQRPAGLAVGVVTAIPWICATATCYWLTRAADRWKNHQALAALMLLAGGIASFVFPSAGPRVGLLALSVAVSAFVVVQPLFWTMPTGYLADRAKAGGIALVGSGNIGGFISPNVKVWADSLFQSPRAGLYLLAAITVLNSALIAGTRKCKQTTPAD
ncbi:MAG: MFS transporter [Terracidiphilus sp.]|nr:MFS transporter [Terracidiphilus sp.]